MRVYNPQKFLEPNPKHTRGNEKDKSNMNIVQKGKSTNDIICISIFLLRFSIGVLKIVGIVKTHLVNTSNIF
jgi:hypothetical protein